MRLRGSGLDAQASLLDADSRVDFFHRLAGVGGASHRTGDVEQQAQAVGAQAVLQGQGQIAALRAHAGSQEPQVGGGFANPAQRFGLGCANHQAYIVVLVPRLRHAGDCYEKAFA